MPLVSLDGVASPPTDELIGVHSISVGGAPLAGAQGRHTPLHTADFYPHLVLASTAPP
jgi:hypothetical protein